MNQSQGISSFLLASAASIALIQPAIATPTQISGVNVRQSSNGVEILLNTPAGEKPQVFAVNRGSTWTADITNSQLRVAEGSFRQENPAPGISLVTVSPLDANSVRVTVVGQGGAPTGQVIRPNQGGVLFSMASPSGGPATAPAAPGQAPSGQASGNPSAPGNQQASNVLVPNPEISLSPLPTPNGVPPLLPNPVPPPVGNMAASTTDSMAPTIELNSNERVPRLVLRDAPAREVLSLLARAAGFNIAYADASAKEGQQSSSDAAAKGAEGPKVSLDIENEPVQSVFNHVLRITGLEAYREGRTIFVGPRLPNSARNMIVRSVRLNQTPVTTALNFMVSLGAESAVSRERQVVSAVAIPVAGATLGDNKGNAAAGSQVQTTTETRIETQRVDYKDSTPLLRGLQVSGDERTNTMTLVGAPKQVEIALAQLTQLDVRRRQVVVNVRVLDLNLASFDRFGASFSFGIDQSRIINDGGIALFNFGSRTPASSNLASTVNGTNIGAAIQPSSTGSASFARGFFGQLQAAVTTGNAKILTDPTLLVQEGQTATVNLTQEVITNFKQDVTTSATSTQVSITVEKARAGLILPIKIDRIDDNGFVSLSVAPSVTQPDRQVPVNFGQVSNTIVLLNERRLETGQLRVRDNQTLILSGIIQDQDRVEVTKVPLLGDIPLLGSLFRRTNRTNERREVIVLLTPRILDESDRANFGYTYQPSPAARQVLDGQTRNQ